MAPITDGKYSVNVYMEAIDICHAGLKRKMNNQSVTQSSDYNVFHTGGGFHIVKKAYERLLRADDVVKKLSPADKAELIQKRLIPSTHLLKLIGPSHTVSTFANTLSVAMSEWDKAIGKTLTVFTYGSGCAATMYQTVFHDVLWNQPLHQWYIDFYRDAIKCPPAAAGRLHDTYIAVWMTFGYYPHGRRTEGIDPWKYMRDVYHLMEIDSFGRRFYHRGGITAQPLDEKFDLKADVDEDRRTRKDWGPRPPIPQKQIKTEKSIEELWREIEADMINHFEPAETEIVQEAFDKVNPAHKIVCTQVKETADLSAVQHDGMRHSYQIVGSWSDFEDAEEMVPTSDAMFSFDITVGENGWERFYLVQDKDWDRKLFPAVVDSWKCMPCVGPYRTNGNKNWFLDARFGAPLEDVGSPGARYRVTFCWSKSSVKQLDWSKLEGQTGEYSRGKYEISWQGSLLEMMSSGDGYFSLEVSLSNPMVEFYLLRNSDSKQRIYPDVPLDTDGNAMSPGSSGDRVMGVTAWHADKVAPVWVVDGSVGDPILITFYRNPELPDEMQLEWSVA